VILLLKNVLFTIFVPGMVAVYVPLLLVRGRPLASAPLVLLGGLALAVGASIYAWCVWDFATFGRGTPAPIDAPKRLVVRGLYRFTRNPMYLGVLTTIAGWALVFGAPDLLVYGAVVGAGFHAFVLFYEEPHLGELFGREYDDYRARVGRWLPRRPAR
jgi:protein-S-isoprenylcysteine O-methyltransferase Ste14